MLSNRITITALRQPNIPTDRWICQSCRSRTQQIVRDTKVQALSWQKLRGIRYSSTKSDKKPYYVTTPIFYVNAAPHVGHLYSMVLADIFKRYQVLIGNNAILSTGTDEHGLKVQQAAQVAQEDPEEFCDRGAKIFKKLAAAADISNNHFVRTTNVKHKEAVQYAWQMLKESNLIYESKHEGWYCVSDETFYPESAIEKKLNPFDGRVFMASQETGKEVEWTSEANYHFRLSKFRDQLLQHYADNPDFVVPSTRMNDVIKQVTEGLEDLSVSRPISRLTWGVPVPDDENQTMYVWLDALMNYATIAGYPWAPGQAQAGGWPADLQIIGKDIVRFHCIYWPAILMALNLPLPKQILTHAHWTLGKQKMAKSTGNVVDPFFAIDRFEVDVMRFYLAHDGGIVNDSDYGNEHIVARYKKGLQGGLGNLVSRVTRPKAWSVRQAVQDVTSGKVARFIDIDLLHEQAISNLPSLYSEAFTSLNASEALQKVMDLVYETNKYLQVAEPWALAKLPEDRIEKERISRIVFNAAESIRIVGILLQPYMPTKSKQLLDMIGVEDSKRTFEHAKYGCDVTYGAKREGVELGKCAFDALFPPLAVEN